MQDLSQTQNQTVQNQTDTPAKPAESPTQQAGQIEEPEIVSVSIEQEPINASVPEPKKPGELLSPEISLTQPSEIVIPHELNKIVEKGPDAIEPKIEKEVRDAGVVPAKESTPVVIMTPNGKITLPETYSEAWKKEKKTNTSEAKHWYAALLMYLWRKYDPDAVKEAKQSLK